MIRLKHFFDVIDFKSILVIALSILFTYVCMDLGFIFDMPTDLIGIAIVFPIVFSPFFAYIAVQNSSFFGFGLAIMYGLVLTSLDNIQDDLEDPFDGVGSDDISLGFPEMLSPKLTQ